MNQREHLEHLGIAVDEALCRFVNNEALLLKVLSKFPADPSFAQLKEAFDARDVKGAYAAAHTLKGVSGSLAMTSIFQTSSDMVEQLRCDHLEEAMEKMPLLEAQYTAMVQGISTL